MFPPGAKPKALSLFPPELKEKRKLNPKRERVREREMYPKVKMKMKMKMKGLEKG